MALKTLVKISNVTNLSDARYCAGMGVDMLGFSMDADAEQYVEPAKFQEIRSWVAGVQIVGETAADDPGAINRLLELYQPDMLQLEDPALLPYVASFNRPVILKADLGLLTLEQLEAIIATSHTGIDFFLLDGKAGISLDDELRTELYHLATRYPILLGTGITASNVHDLLAALPVKGIALQGGDEVRPGNKEFGELMDILETIEVED
ncbi:hypothetical protein GCM10023189_19920 [Nibrella saemangeumensis]|uniref:N-(5'-phosphoribosyl)anthranilate isomerase n=1 Tax=Nibrella saemangeumensis TaxID=1084526 RepID=A0ABP8MPE5_9BACT